MRQALQHYIDGHWVDPETARSADVVNPATEECVGKVAIGNAADVDRAAVAARRAFASYRRSSRQGVAALAEAAATIRIGDPLTNPDCGPVVSRGQFDKIQALIEAGVAEGATLIAGGPGRPDGLDRGFFVRPTIFADVTNDMTIAREEIFGRRARRSSAGRRSAPACRSDRIDR